MISDKTKIGECEASIQVASAESGILGRRVWTERVRWENEKGGAKQGRTVLMVRRGVSASLIVSAATELERIDGQALL